MDKKGKGRQEEGAGDVHDDGEQLQPSPPSVCIIAIGMAGSGKDVITLQRQLSEINGR